VGSMPESVAGSTFGVAIYSADVQRLTEFYAGVLGLEVVERDDGYVVLSGGAGEVSIVAVPAPIADTIVVARPPELREEAPIKPVFAVASLATAAADAAALGGGTKPMAAAWEFRGMKRLDGFDPEGNVLQLAEPLTR